MKQLLCTAFTLILSVTCMAQTQHRDSSLADSAQKEKIYKMPMDSTHERSLNHQVPDSAIRSKPKPTGIKPEGKKK